MFKEIENFLLVLLFFLASGCAQKVTIDHGPVSTGFSAQKIPSKVLILPLSWYEKEDSFHKWFKTNVLYFEGIADGFAKQGIAPIPFEESFWLCVKKGFIRVSYERPKIPSGIKEILNDPLVSANMKQEIAKLIPNIKGRFSFNQSQLLRLTEDDIWQLGALTGARYVVRGQIVEFLVRSEDTLDPFKIGFLSFPVRFSSRTLYGRGKNEKWTLLQEVSVGLGVGALLGFEAKDPVEPRRKETIYTLSTPQLSYTVTKFKRGAEDYDIGNAIFWGLVGSGLATLSHYGGRSPEVVLGLALYIYDTNSKSLLYYNRVRLRVAPETIWASAHIEDLIFKGMLEATNLLTTQFWKDMGVKSKDLAHIQLKDLQTLRAKAEEAAYRAEKAAQRSEKAAVRAERAAIKAERIFEKFSTK